MSESPEPSQSSEPSPVVRRADDVAYEPVDAADGLEKGVLVDEARGAPNFAIRRFTLAPGAEVPKHTNEVEHEQYVLEGEYVVGISEASKTPREDGDSEAHCASGRASGQGPRAEAVDDDEEHTVSAGDSLLIPAGTVHWYRNEGDEEGAFICAVPNGDDAIELVE
ncbi:cupin domain-containing protein [Halococcus saccharolyticus]|uniref:Cupin n=1 Tax=Halococcus saccharolyticus DSM 5350 TaxID=1227455 RepID=M0MDP7_9EURY|nr:cupin domain-containing protein [Halococcus saccharolyticus]EMA43871.1 cupin [Halococcus saccharolyticus DSM 5350]